MIKGFKHKGLENFFLKGSKKGIQPAHETRLRLQLAALDKAQSELEMDLPGWGFHGLKGDKKDHYAVTINGNWRLTFKFEDGHAYVVNYQDYH